MEFSWEEIRDEFPITKKYAYFQSAGMSPLPNRVLDAVTESYRKVNQFGDMYWTDELDRTNRVKSKLASMINTKPSNLVFAHNTSTAFIFLAAAIKAKNQDFNLVSLMDEFPSTNIPFEFQGIKLKFVKPDNGVYTVDRILDAADDQTIGVVCSYVQYATGFRLNIEELGQRLKEKDLLFILNATQAFPVYDVDVQKCNVDAMTVSFHKWGLCAHVGSLFFTSQKFREKYPNPMAGWLSVYPSENDFIPTQKEKPYVQYKDANQYNFGTMNFQAVAGLEASLELMEQIGRERIRNRITELISYLIERLAELPVQIISPVKMPGCRSGIILVDAYGKDNNACVDFLRKYDVITSIRAGKIRISCNFFNNHEDIDRLIKAMDLFVSGS
jgi:cysteine desulfurase / selenocysteine lyase